MKLSQGKNRNYEWQSCRDGAKTENDIVDGRTCDTTKNDFFFFEVLKQLLMGKESRAIG